MINNRNLPILGVNTDPSRSVGCLCNRKIHYESRDYNISMMFKHLERENFEFFHRQRLLFELEDQATNRKFQQLSLNEIFVAEKNVSQTSIYRLKVDGNYIGKFKSSGLIVSTGTGSTGWLYSARRYTELDVQRALHKLGAYNEPDLVHQHIAKALSDNTVFPPDEAQMYYYVREPCAGFAGGFETHA